MTLLAWTTLDLYLGEHLSQRFLTRTIAEDAHRRLLLVQRGFPMWHAKLPNSIHLRDIAHDERPSNGYEFEPSTWTKGEALILQPRGKRYAIWTLLDDASTVTGWYVNFEDRRERDGIVAIRDFELDLTISRDRVIAVKDAESFLAKTGTRGHWSTADVAYLPEASREITSFVESRSGAFIASMTEDAKPAMAVPPAPPTRLVYPDVRRITSW